MNVSYLLGKRDGNFPPENRTLHLTILNATTHPGAPSDPNETQLAKWIKRWPTYANNIVKPGNAATKADFEMSVLTPMCETHKPHTNAYDGEGTPNPITEYFSWVAQECPPVNANNEH